MTEPFGFWDMLASIPAGFEDLPADRTQAGIRQALTALLPLFDVDRASLTSLATEGRPQPGASFTVGRPGAPQMAPATLRSFRWLLAELGASRTVSLPRLPHGLPSIASAEREWVAATGAGAMLAVPLRSAGRLAAILSADCFGRSRDFSPDDAGRLRVVGHVLLGALRHRSAEDGMKARLAESLSSIERLEREIRILRQAAVAPDDLALSSVERAHIRAVLASCRWRVEGRGNAAETLRLTPSTLRYRMKTLGIRRPA